MLTFLVLRFGPIQGCSYDDPHVPRLFNIVQRHAIVWEAVLDRGLDKKLIVTLTIRVRMLFVVIRVNDNDAAEGLEYGSFVDDGKDILVTCHIVRVFVLVSMEFEFLHDNGRELNYFLAYF